MDLEALRSANFSLLDDALSDWSKMVDNLARMEEAAGKGLKAAANKANWAGVNATVSKEFIGKTAEEFSDAHLQAKSIRDILRDTRDELKEYQRKLKTAIKNGQDKNLQVTTTGSGFTVRADRHADSATKGTSTSGPSKGDVNALRDEIQEILNKATESDSTASTVLQAIADQSAVGFSGVNYSDRDEAADAIKKADELSKLAKKDPEDLSTAEFDRLNAGFKNFADDELFSQRFATNLGAKGTLEFWAGINDPNANPELNHARHDKFDDLQKNLSLTLATATQSDAIGMTEWSSKMVDIGNQPVRGGGPLGFQVMSNLMRSGDFDDRFLHSYGKKLMETEKELTGNGEGRAWRRTSSDPHLNRTGSDTGWDPMTGFMKGLSNNPDAATDFFNDRFISKNDENNPFNGQNKSNFQYLFEEREWPTDFDSQGDHSDTGRNNLALALEAATTGHPAGELPTVQIPTHTAEQAKLTESIFASVSADPKHLTDHGYMSDSFGQIASEYLPDMNRAITNDPDGETNKLFPISGSEANLDHRDVTRFLFSVSQNNEGYAAVEVGQKSYMADLMEYHLNPDLPTDLRYSKDDKFVIEEIADKSGQVSGTLSQGRAEAVAGEAEEKDKDYERSVAQWKNGISGGAGTGIGIGTSFILNPVTGAAVGGAATTVSGAILEDLFKDAEGKAKAAAGPVMGEHWESGMDSNNKYTEKAAELAAKAHDRTNLPDAGNWALAAAGRGYDRSGTSVTAMASDLKTDI